MFSCKGNRKGFTNLSEIHFRFNSKVQQGIEKNSWLTKKPFKNNAKKENYETFHISLTNSYYCPYFPVSYSFGCTCIISRSAHRTPNFTNPEFQFPQFKVLQSVFFLFNITSYIGIFGCILILI